MTPRVAISVTPGAQVQRMPLSFFLANAGGRPKVRGEATRLLEFALRLLARPSPRKGGGQLIVRLRIVRGQPDGLAILRDRAGHVSALQQPVADADRKCRCLRVGLSLVERACLLECRRRRVAAALLLQDGAEHVMRVRVITLLRNRVTECSRSF